MQTSKARKSSSEVHSPQSSAPKVFQRLSARSASSEVSQKVSPRSSSEVANKISGRVVSVEVPQKISPRVARKLQTAGLESDPASSSNNLKAPKDKSPKITDRKSPRSPVPERKRTSKVAELESHISQLQDDLKRVKEQLSLSESRKVQAQQDAEESKEKLQAMPQKLEESRSIELQNASHEKDKEIQTEVEASETTPSKRTAEVTCALDEIRQLKLQLEMVTESEARQIKQTEQASAELLRLKENLAETRLLAEDMKDQLKDCKDSEVQAHALVGQTLLQLETAKQTVETLGSDNTKAKEAYDAIAFELDQSKARVTYLEELVTKLTKKTATAANNDSPNSAGEEAEKSIEAKLVYATTEVENLRSALEAAEIRYHEEQIQSTVQITGAYELVEKIKSTSSQREDELEAELAKLKADVEELRANLMDKETELQGICEENEVLNTRLETNLSGRRENQLGKELQKTKMDVESTKSSLIEKETDIQTILKENEMLKSVNKKKELNLGNVGAETVSELDAARAAERDALMKLGYATEEVDKSHRRAAQMTEQLEAAQYTNSELEAELRRIKIQSDQWRKAAEAAASMLSTGNNGELVERSVSLDSNYSPNTEKISSRYAAEDTDDEFLKKKNGNMLKKIGVLWKKPQK